MHLQGDSLEDANDAMDAFKAEFSPKYERAVTCLFKDWEQLQTYFSLPAEHWVHLRTTNVIESSFATLRLRHRVTKGSGSRTKGISMAFKLLTMAEKRWRKLNGRKLLPLVRAGEKFVDGVQKREQEAA